MSNSIIHRLISITVLLAAAATSAGAQETIKLERFRKALWKVHVVVNGKPGEFLFDTGSGVTHVTEKFSKDLTCKFWGRTTGYNMFGTRADGPHCDDVKISAGGLSLTPASIGKHDFDGMFAGDKEPDGLLALDVFDGKAITIDQRAASITIETPKSLASRVAHMTEVPFRLGRECSGRCLSAFMGIPTREGVAWLNMDTGAGGVTLIAKDQAALFGLDPEKKEQQLSIDAGRGIRLEGAALVTDMIMDGNLGQPFLSRYVITIDLKNGRCWFGS